MKIDKYLIHGMFTGAITGTLLGLLCGGCATNGATQTPAQIATQVCPVVTASIVALQADTGLSGSAQNVLASVQPKVAPICSAASQATATDIQTLENFAFQVVLPIATAANPKLASDLTAVQIIVGAIEAGQAAATVPASK